MTAKHETQRYTLEELQKYWQGLAQEKDGFVGYVWMADAPLQYIMTSPSPLPAWQALHQNNSFIWEANLYQQDKRSVTIRQVNDRWLVSEVKWQGEPDKAQGNFLDHRYLVRGLEHDKKLTIREAWLPENDPLCENMEVLKPAWTAFIGFSNKEN